MMSWRIGSPVYEDVRGSFTVSIERSEVPSPCCVVRVPSGSLDAT